MNPTAGTGFRQNRQSLSNGSSLQQTSLHDPVASNTAKPAEADASLDMDTETLQTGLNNRGYSAGAIDGKLGPKTLEALNIFQQDQIDSLKAQIHNTPNPALRAQMEIRLSALIKESSGIKPGRETLSALADPRSKRVAKSASGGLESVAVRQMPAQLKASR